MGGRAKTDDNQQDNAPARKLDECQREGGLYVKNGRVVDAVGAVIAGWIVDSDGSPVQLSDAGK